MKSIFQFVLIKLFVLKHKGKDYHGSYIANGLNKLNPLSYVVAFVFASFTGFLAFCGEFAESWKVFFNNSK